MLHRVLKTLDRSRQLEYRLARMGPEEAREAYYEAVLGKDWKQQLQADWDKALEDVDAGLVTGGCGSPGEGAEGGERVQCRRHGCVHDRMLGLGWWAVAWRGSSTGGALSSTQMT